MCAVDLCASAAAAAAAAGPAARGADPAGGDDDSVDVASLGLDELEAALVRAVGAIGATPPVIIAHGAGGFVAQRYLEVT